MTAVAVVNEAIEATLNRTRSDLYMLDRLKEGTPRADVVAALMAMGADNSWADSAVDETLLLMKREQRGKGIAHTFCGALVVQQFWNDGQTTTSPSFPRRRESNAKPSETQPNHRFKAVGLLVVRNF